jgi:hypothetical protein
MISYNLFIQQSIGYENPTFFDQESSVPNLGNGKIVTTKLQKEEEDDDDDDDDKNNKGFERLSGKGNPIGLFVVKIRKALIYIIKKQKV